MYDVAQRLPHAMGGLVRAEIEVLRKLTEEPERPYVVVLGGSKVSDKLAVIDNLLGKADKLLIGGGMVFTFLKAAGPRGRQEPARGGPGRDLPRLPPARPQDTGVEIILPTDVVVAPRVPGRRSSRRRRSWRSTRSLIDQIGLDIGPDSGAAFAKAIARRAGPCSGTARWASSSSTPSPRAPAPSPGADRDRRPLRGRRRRLRGRRTPARLRRRAPSGTSPPVAAPASSTSRARSSPA